MNSTIYRQGDSRWKDLPYPTKAYKFGSNGCGCCSVTHCIIELDKYKNYTPADVRKYMVQYATQGHGTLWKGITAGLENYGYKVHWKESDTMADIWKVLKASLNRGVLFFGKKNGPDGTNWTDGGHYISFVDYKIQNNQHWFYLKDSGGRHHDKWWCYEKSMKGDVKNVWICTGLKDEPKPTPTPDPKPKYETYSGKFPTKTIRKGSKGTNVKKWQNFLKWMGYSLNADKVFGAKTEEKTKAAQKKFGFTGKEVDGIVGPNTIKKAKAYKKQVNP